MYLKIAMCVLIISCNTDDEIPATEEFKIRANSQITIPPQDSDYFVVTVDPGNKLVFEYHFKSASDPGVADSQSREHIVFEIQPNIEEFSVKDEELINLNSFYTLSCFCPNTNSIRIANGSISGVKIDSTSWLVTINVQINLGTEVIEKKINRTFIQS